MEFSAAGITIIKSLFEAIFSNSYSIQNVLASELYMKRLKSHLPGARLKFLLHKYHTREDLAHTTNVLYRLTFLQISIFTTEVN